MVTLKSIRIWFLGAMLLPLLTAAPLQAQRIPAGTVVKVRLLQDLSSKTARVGDRVRVQVAEEDRSGLASDTVLVGRITEVRQASGSSPGVIDIHFGALERNGRWQAVAGSLHSLDERDVRADASGRLMGKQRKQDQAKLIGYGAAGGAVLGYLLKSKTKDALTGALLGAAAGYVYSESQKKKGYEDVDLKAGSEFGVYLNRPLAVGRSVAVR